MAKITIDDVEYETDEWSDEAKAQLLSLQFCEIELQNLQAEAAAIQTARIAYSNALKAELYCGPVMRQPVAIYSGGQG